MSSVRAFLAIPLPEQLKDSIRALQRRLQTQITSARWVRPENLHLTLHFFAEIEQETLEKIRVSMLSVRGCSQPFPVEVKGLGAFPNLHRPRVIWLDLEPKEQLRQLHLNCRKILRHAGVAVESRPYSPHLTIARMRHLRTDLTTLLNPANMNRVGHLPVHKLVLYESRLHPDGAEHIPLQTISFDKDETDETE